MCVSKYVITRAHIKLLIDYNSIIIYIIQTMHINLIVKLIHTKNMGPNYPKYNIDYWCVK